MEKPSKTAIKKALKESIEHWKTMIEWVGLQRINDYAYTKHMRKAIGMAWLDDSCALCQICRTSGDAECYGCPLGNNSYCCQEWGNVNTSINWGEWYRNAKIMLARLENELEKTKLKPQKK